VVRFWSGFSDADAFIGQRLSALVGIR